MVCMRYGINLWVEVFVFAMILNMVYNYTIACYRLHVNMHRKIYKNVRYQNNNFKFCFVAHIADNLCHFADKCHL